MTSSAVTGYIVRAQTALAEGRCDEAGEDINAGWTALNDYAQALAARGASPAQALRFHKLLAKLHARRQKKCVTDSLIAPSFSGPLSYSNLFPMMGFVFAAVGLGLGVWTVYKNS